MFAIKFFRSYSIIDIFKNLAAADNRNNLLKYENRLMIATLAPVIMIAGLVLPMLILFWTVHTPLTHATTLIFMVGAEVMFYLGTKNFNENLTRHILSIILVLLICLTYYVLYEYIHILFWFVILITAIPTILNTTRNTLNYLLITTLVLLVHTFTVQNTTQVDMNPGFSISFIIIIVIILIEVYLLNRLYKEIIDYKYRQFHNIIDQKEEITSLYEEMLANEEELREKNIQLNEYNKEIIKNQEKLHFIANNDVLTHLPNRKQIQDKIIENINTKKQFALICIDLDSFKDINDTLGHRVGDQLLVAVAHRFKEASLKGDILGRLGGDEFALITDQWQSEESLVTYVETLANRLTYTFMINHYDINISASFGIAICPTHASNSIDLISAADTAMYEAKGMGKNQIVIYRDEMKEAVRTRLEMEKHLLKALSNDEFFIEYQPILNSIDKIIDGFEALIRWQSPYYGRMSPLSFIPLAEDLGLIYSIGNWVIEQACQKINQLQAHFAKSHSISVNVSAIQINHSQFVEDVTKIIQRTGVDPNLLIFELTESVFIDNLELARNVIFQLKQLGISIAIDDFGTGYSSLNYIINLPIDTLKIDKSFTQSIEASPRIRNVIASIIGIGHNLQLSVIAEGVEADTEKNYLTECHCDYLQGYYFSKPLPETEMIPFIESNAINSNEHLN